MKRSLLLLLILCALPAGAGELGLALRYEFVPAPVGTEKMWSLDPDQLNPHRKRWVVSRNAGLKGLEATELKEGRFGARASAIESVSRGYIRGPGPWYRPLSEFPCSQQPEAWFATEDGARRAVDAAAETWSSVLRGERPKLARQLSLISEPSRHEAVRKALAVYDAWLRRTEAEWRAKSSRAATMAEWRFYLDTAVESKQCRIQGGKLGPAQPPAEREPEWAEMMEPPGQTPPAKPLARIPARRWNGMYSVRLSVEVAARGLTGQFLVDTGAGKSVMSPAWLDAQGMPLSFVELKESGPQRVTFTGGSGLAHRGMVDRSLLSGFDIGVEEFLIFNTDLFNTPRNLATCCDGILGTDFLRKHVVEFRPGPPAEILIWPRADFTPPAGPKAPRGDVPPVRPPWSEAHVTSAGEAVTDCLVRSEKDPFGSKGARPLRGARWDTGSDVALDIHSPWTKEARAGGGLWSLDCGEQVIAREIPATLHPNAKKGSAFARTYPATNIGMPILGRGSVFFDLPHGRIWFDREAIRKPVPENRSGLVLDYSLSDGDRVLKVVSIAPRSPAARLVKDGLAKGSVIEAIDGKSAADMDLWEVEQRLSGVYGDQVQISWKQKSGAMIAVPLPARGEK